MSSFPYSTSISEVQLKAKVYPRTDYEGQDRRELYSSSALDGCGQLTQGLDRLPPGKRTGLHFIRGWVGVREVLNGCKKSRLPPGFDPRTAQPGTSRYIDCAIHTYINHLTPNGHYMGRTAQLTSRCCILYIYSTNIRTEYFKHAA